MPQTKKIMFIFGTRPEAIKMAPIMAEIKKHKTFLKEVVVVTGQHREMLDQVLSLFGIQPDHDLRIMEEGQTVSSVVGKSLRGLESVIVRERPDFILVQGDTSTTFAASLAAFYHRVPLGHVEAGLRTYNKFAPFPEEINRRLTSQLADLHFAPTQTAVLSLLKENVEKDRIVLTGNTVIDALLTVAGRPYDLSNAGINIKKDRKNILLTAHRRENFGEPLEQICKAVRKIAENYAKVEIFIPVHRNPKVRSTVKSLLGRIDNIQLIEPLGYEAFVHLMKASYLILTDSGGIQEEAPSLGKPVLVLRDITERPEAVEAGVVRVIGTKSERILEETEKLLTRSEEYDKMVKKVNPYGDGQASLRIIGELLYQFGFTKQRPEELGVQT